MNKKYLLLTFVILFLFKASPYSFEVDIAKCKDGETIKVLMDKVILVGNITDEVTIVAIAINEMPLKITTGKEVAIRKEFNLKKGENKIKIEIEKENGSITTKWLNIVYMEETISEKVEEIKKEEVSQEKKEDVKTTREVKRLPFKKLSPNVAQQDTESRITYKTDAAKPEKYFLTGIISVHKNKVKFYLANNYGTRKGNILTILRKDYIPVGTVKVVEIQGNYYIAEITSITSGHKITTSDIIKGPRRK